MKPSLVILASSDNHVTPRASSAIARLSVQEWTNGVRGTLEVLNANEIRTLLLRDTPGPGIDVPTCLSRANVRHKPEESCAVARNLAIREDVFQASLAAARGLPYVSVLDLTDEFCTSRVCPPTIHGAIAYGQPGHISDSFGPHLAPVITRRIAPLVECGVGTGADMARTLAGCDPRVDIAQRP